MSDEPFYSETPIEDATVQLMNLKDLCEEWKYAHKIVSVNTTH